MDADPRNACVHLRREFLRTSAALACTLWLPGAARAAQIRTLEGKVSVNGKPARGTTPIKPGDVVETAPGARLIFVVGEDAFLLRQRSRLALEPAGAGAAAVAGLRMLSGALLAVSGRGGRRFTTATATIGIRGTGVYIEAQADQTYLCTCYERSRSPTVPARSAGAWYRAITRRP